MRRRFTKKGEAVSKQEDQKMYLFYQITCKSKIRWARLRLLRSEFAKYDELSNASEAF